MVAEGPLEADLALLDRPLEDDLGVRRHLEVDGLRLDELDRLALEEAREHQLVDVLRQRRARRVGGDRVEPERDRDRDTAVGGEVVSTAVLVQLPVHEGRAAVDLLHPVHAHVAAAVPRILRDHRGERDERRGIAGPAALDRQQAEIDVVARQHDLLAGAAGDRLRARVGDRLQLLEAAHLVHQPLRRLHLEHVLEPRGDVVEALDAEAQAHAPLRAELVDQKRVPCPLRALEQERRPARLDGPVDDLRDLEVGVDLGGDANELTLALEQRDPLAQVSRRSHRGQSTVASAYSTASSSVSRDPSSRARCELEAVEREHTLGGNQLVEFPRERAAGPPLPPARPRCDRLAPRHDARRLPAQAARVSTRDACGRQSGRRAARPRASGSPPRRAPPAREELLGQSLERHDLPPAEADLAGATYALLQQRRSALVVAGFAQQRSLDRQRLYFLGHEAVSTGHFEALVGERLGGASVATLVCAVRQPHEQVRDPPVVAELAVDAQALLVAALGELGLVRLIRGAAHRAQAAGAQLRRCTRSRNARVRSTPSAGP